jgi:hypothetical protein
VSVISFTFPILRRITPFYVDDISLGHWQSSDWFGLHCSVCEPELLSYVGRQGHLFKVINLGRSVHAYLRPPMLGCVQFEVRS